MARVGFPVLARCLARLAVEGGRLVGKCYFGRTIYPDVLGIDEEPDEETATDCSRPELESLLLRERWRYVRWHAEPGSRLFDTVSAAWARISCLDGYLPVAVGISIGDVIVLHDEELQTSVPIVLTSSFDGSFSDWRRAVAELSQEENMRPIVAAFEPEFPDLSWKILHDVS